LDEHLNNAATSDADSRATTLATTMDSYNLKTASTYINNLLLARGLLRNGKPIEFAHPSRGDGGKEATMAQIINLVHDLILKRDVGIRTCYVLWERVLMRR
jgi:hypothetical protein